MKRCYIGLSVLLTFFMQNTSVLAHSKALEHSPKTGESVQAPLEEITLNFSKTLRLVTFTLFTLADDEQAQDQDLNLEDNAQAKPIAAPSKTFRKSHALAFEPLPAGQYFYQWTGMARDGHKMTGTGHFTVAP